MLGYLYCQQIGVFCVASSAIPRSFARSELGSVTELITTIGLSITSVRLKC